MIDWILPPSVKIIELAQCNNGIVRARLKLFGIADRSINELLPIKPMACWYLVDPNGTAQLIPSTEIRLEYYTLADNALFWGVAAQDGMPNMNAIAADLTGNVILYSYLVWDAESSFFNIFFKGDNVGSLPVARHFPSFKHLVSMVLAS